jgi:acyl-coenzyme A synthetase/AMP-(fatty) acid ligase
VQGDRRISFVDRETAVAAVSMLLRERGVGLGDRIMLDGANSIEWVISFWAILHVGAIAVLGNGWWTKVELEHSIRVATPKLVVTDATSCDASSRARRTDEHPGSALWQTPAGLAMATWRADSRYDDHDRCFPPRPALR